jgi:phosphatidylserine decarboxylase
MLFFYRYYQHDTRYYDNVVVCPCDGTITDIHQDKDFYFVSIFLSPFNVHNQIYPVNGIVTSQYYDKTGIFSLAINKAKSRYNDKVIHKIQTQYGYVTITQISGFLPRCIVYNHKVNHRVQAGEYLGMIKFGSRVDLKIPKTNYPLLLTLIKK